MPAPTSSPQTAPQFASEAQECSDYSPATQSPREMHSSSHPPYAALRETQARYNPDPQPAPHKQSSAGSRPRAAGEINSVTKLPAPTACDRTFFRRSFCPPLVSAAPLAPRLPSRSLCDFEIVPATPSAQIPHPRHQCDCTPPAAARSLRANSPGLRFWASPATASLGASISNAPAIATTSPATAIPMPDSDTPPAAELRRATSFLYHRRCAPS